MKNIQDLSFDDLKVYLTGLIGTVVEIQLNRSGEEETSIGRLMSFQIDSCEYTGEEPRLYLEGCPSIIRLRKGYHACMVGRAGSW